MEPTSFRIGDVPIGGGGLPVIVAGPCVIESEDHALMMAERLSAIAKTAGFRLVFKASYDKANRSSIHSYRGPGLDEGLRILSKIRTETGLPILTDIHAVEHIQAAAEVVDIIQIPAFLCRQTDLYLEAGKYPVPVNVKKGQFMSPGDTANVVEKARVSGIKAISLTERGTSFGYNRLVVDFTGISTMRDLNVPVIFDATHAIQQPGGGGTFTSGNRSQVHPLCRAAVAVGIDGLFLEVHDRPEHALSDGSNMIPLEVFQSILHDVHSIHTALTR